MDYISAHEAAEKWSISQRRVSVLCASNRILNAEMVGNMWIIPAGAEKPNDARKGGSRSQIEKPKELKPFLKWAGGKRQLLETIGAAYPPGLGRQLNRYAEPFVGGGAVLIDVLARYNLTEAYISDTNQELINTYLAVKDRVEDLIACLTLLQEEFLPMGTTERKRYYYQERSEFNAISLGVSDEANTRKAALFIFLNRTCFNGLYRVNRKGEFNVPMGAYKNPRICDARNLRAVASALQGVTIVCGNYTLSEDFVDATTFVYMDPPYRPLTKTANFTAYTEDSFDDDCQVALAHYVDWLTDEKHALVLASNSDPKNSDPYDEFFDKLYKRHNIRRVSATRLINRNADSRGTISELLISNY